MTAAPTAPHGKRGSQEPASRRPGVQWRPFPTESGQGTQKISPPPPASSDAIHQSYRLWHTGSGEPMLRSPSNYAIATLAPIATVASQLREHPVIDPSRLLPESIGQFMMIAGLSQPMRRHQRRDRRGARRKMSLHHPEPPINGQFPKTKPAPKARHLPPPEAIACAGTTPLPRTFPLNPPGKIPRIRPPAP
jgi:hypothetical protein